MWRNFCISDTYEPGSTMKPFTVAAGLESGTLTGNETYYCGGSLRVADYDIGCHLRSGHGMETIQDAIANSCNVALMTMAEVSEWIISQDISIFLVLGNIQALIFRGRPELRDFYIRQTI